MHNASTAHVFQFLTAQTWPNKSYGIGTVKRECMMKNFEHAGSIYVISRENEL